MAKQINSTTDTRNKYSREFLLESQHKNNQQSKPDKPTKPLVLDPSVVKVPGKFGKLTCFNLIPGQPLKPGDKIRAVVCGTQPQSVKEFFVREPRKAGFDARIQQFVMEIATRQHKHRMKKDRVLFDDLDEGSVCLMKHPRDNQWYRSVVTLRVPETHAHVLHFDTGESFKIRRMDDSIVLLEISSELQVLAPTALKVCWASTNRKVGVAMLGELHREQKEVEIEVVDVKRQVGQFGYLEMFYYISIPEFEE